MKPTKLGTIKKDQADKALASTRHLEELAHIDNVSQTVLSATSSLIQYLEGLTSKTEVINQLESISTPDVKFVVEALEVLDKTIKNTPQTDLSGITQLMQELVNEAKQIPKDPQAIDIPQAVDNTDQLSSLLDAVQAVEKVVKAQKLIAEAPIVNVPETSVHVDAPDLKPLQNGFKDVVTAVKGIVIPEYKTDTNAVQKLLKETNETLDKLLKKPISSGGGGGSSWTAIGTNNLPAPLNLDSNGYLKTVSSGGGGGGDVQYTDGDVALTHPIGTIPVFNKAGTITAVSDTNPLPTSSTVSLTNYANETGGNLATIATKDFATQTTLALIKAKTDNLDVALSTRTKPADAQHVIVDSGVTTGLTDTQLRATPVPVSGTFFQTTQPVSGTVAVTGVSTAANQTTGNSSLSSIDTKLSGSLTTVTTGNVGTTSHAINVGQTTSATSATQLTASSIVSTNGILVQALSTNIASIFIGGSGVTTGTGFEIQPGQGVPFTASNMNLLYTIGANGTDGACWNVL